ncbi:uncharacterized protein TNCV_1821171 [Trichonephila clavipes]|nr:uncharacterized protein TNCV_1821171 [Trichonephila clavipes]
MEIRTGISDSNSSCHKLSNFESLQRISNESQYGRKKRSPPGSWSVPNRKLKIGRKETLACKRSLDSGYGGPERKIRKSTGHRVDNRTLSSNNTNDLLQLRKKVRTEETVMQRTSGYNLRPRRGAKVESRRTTEERTQEGGPVRVRKAEIISTVPTSKSKQGQVAEIQEAEVVNNRFVRRGKEERTATDPSPWSS